MGTIRAVFVAAAAASLLGGCGGEDGDEPSGAGATSGGGDDPCLLKVELSGAVAETLDWNLQQGCGGGSTPDVMTVGWGGITTDLNVKLSVAVTEGQPGSGLAAQMRISNAGLVWMTAADGCQVDLATFELEKESSIGKSYRVGGSGRCPGPADITENGATGAVTIGDFELASTTLY